MTRRDTAFRGDTTLNMDAKGRIAVPARLRDRFEETDENTVVVTVSPTARCLAVYPFSRWLQVEAQFMELPSLNPSVVAVRQAMIGSAHEITLDGQHRILTPPTLREHASLAKRVTVVGALTHFEIWNEEAWTSRRKQVLDDLAINHSNMDEALANVRL